MKKLSVLLLLLTAQLIFAGNLLKNSQFDNTDLYCDMLFKAARGKFKVEHFIEDRTWNKACRIEYIKPYKKGNDPESCFLSILWSAEKNGGVKVKPNTRYRFSMSVKGNVPQKSCFVQVIEWNGDGFWTAAAG